MIHTLIANEHVALKRKLFSSISMLLLNINFWHFKTETKHTNIEIKHSNMYNKCTSDHSSVFLVLKYNVWKKRSIYRLKISRTKMLTSYRMNDATNWICSTMGFCVYLFVLFRLTLFILLYLFLAFNSIFITTQRPKQAYMSYVGLKFGNGACIKRTNP